MNYEFIFPLSVLNWNVRGLGDANKCAVIKELACDDNPDIICFQETKLSNCDIFKLRQVCRSKIKNFLTLNADGSRGGILLAWSSLFTAIDSIVLTYSVTVVVKRGDFTFMCTGVYGPQDDASKRIFLNELRSIRAMNDYAWILMGDFNLLRSELDTTSQVTNIGTMQDFNNFIDEAGLFETPLQGRTFTWSNKRPRPTFSKLDRVLLSGHWNTFGASVTLGDLPTTASDHAPLSLRLKPHVDRGKKQFKFENFWLKYDGIQEVVQSAWNSVVNTDPAKNIQYKI